MQMKITIKSAFFRCIRNFNAFEREYLWPLKKKKKVQEMHKIKVQPLHFKMPYLEANKIRLFWGKVSR